MLDLAGCQARVLPVQLPAAIAGEEPAIAELVAVGVTATDLDVAAGQQDVGLDHAVVPGRIAEEGMRLEQPVVVPEESLGRHDLRDALATSRPVIDLERALLVGEVTAYPEMALPKILGEGQGERHVLEGEYRTSLYAARSCW